LTGATTMSKLCSALVSVPPPESVTDTVTVDVPVAFALM
jgi:hypothetical protein